MARISSPLSVLAIQLTGIPAAAVVPSSSFPPPSTSSTLIPYNAPKQAPIQLAAVAPPATILRRIASTKELHVRIASRLVWKFPGYGHAFPNVAAASKYAADNLPVSPQEELAGSDSLTARYSVFTTSVPPSPLLAASITTFSANAGKSAHVADSGSAVIITRSILAAIIP
eukprot:CAMPEP_0175019156 /NCGR_PEP_ID=MMETSP0005-20121125/13397_1 /TAXON_ID=420556 /ORGANISM="Ochromonas sp., Strain CCMP1393" /LENGTH=170 /DNA_ID=CAMNT_0016276851 /DNA_START=27 /DNA_END=540 /DNA_ORIENTATION=-